MKTNFDSIMTIVLAGIVLVPWASMAHANDAPVRLELSSQDRILVIAPHPDDETIGAAGVIQETIRLKIPVRVMYLTNGDSNPLAFALYKKRPVLGRKEALAMGELRQQEAIEAMADLGLTKDQLTFLSYPDYGTLNIFRKYWRTKTPYRSTLTRVRFVPYTTSLTPGAAHDAESILSDFKKELLNFKPTKVFVTHPADDNADHQAAYLFLRVALWDVQEQLGDIPVYAYLVHAVGWPRPLGLNPQLRLLPELYGHSLPEQWSSFELNPEQLQHKQKVIHHYRTQIPYKPLFLYSFVRANEPFAEISDFELRSQSLDTNEQFKNNRHNIVLKSIAYTLESEHLIVRIRLNQWSRPGFNINLYLFGYNKNVSFAAMPKYRVQLNNDHEAIIFDGQQRVRLKGIKIFRTGNDLFVSFPLSLMHGADRVMASAAMRVQNWPEEFSTWKVLRLSDGY